MLSYLRVLLYRNTELGQHVAGVIVLQAYKTFGNRVMTVWKKFEEQRAVIQAAIESPVDEAGVSSSSSVDHEVEDKDWNQLEDDVAADDTNEPLPYIGPPFIDEPLNDEDICKCDFCVNFFPLLLASCFCIQIVI